jgi:3-methylfumaryl-CoA hydratase
MTESFDAWIGRSETAEAVVTLEQCRHLAATLDMDEAARQAAGIVEGGLLPPLWHWMGWTPDAPMSGLGADGHPARGGFLPPVPLERRMWAGGRLTFHRPARIGAVLQRRSEITRIDGKTGATGPMVFVTVRHGIASDGEAVLTEEQDIVYVAMPETFVPPPPVPAPGSQLWSEPVPIDTVRLFRFSAVTFNAHRIHFDLDYAQKVEKYPGLVVHGPMQAIFLMEAARRRHAGAFPASFRFRGVRPLFHFDALRLVGHAVGEGRLGLATVQGDGVCAMQAEIGWQGAE